MKQAVSLYIHIPFCVRKCGYCDFASFSGCPPETQKDYVRALLQEMNAYREEAAGYAVQTIFLGGGTPSILPEGAIERILSGLRAVWEVAADAEITLEANPGTLTREKLAEYRMCGVNRLSLGLQSSENQELRLLGRIHNYEQFVANYQLARELGFSNLNVDVMAALPGQTLHSYGQTLARVAQLEPEHISAYSLTVEEGTPLSADETLLSRLPSEQTERRMYHYTRQALKGMGYERYEISNYARPGYACRHNQVYWTCGEYLGLGLAAASDYQGARFRNTKDLREYLRLTALGDVSALRREVTPDTRRSRMEEFMFLGLRRMRGVSEREFEKRFGVPMEAVYGVPLADGEAQGLLTHTKEGWRLTERGIDVSNVVLAEFLLSDENIP